MTRLIVFHAEWCAPCSQQEPIIDEIEEETDVDVERYDVDEASETANEYNVRSVPTIIVESDDGQTYTTFQGLTQKNEIVEAL